MIKPIKDKYYYTETSSKTNTNVSELFANITSILLANSPRQTKLNCVTKLIQMLSVKIEILFI